MRRRGLAWGGAVALSCALGLGAWLRFRDGHGDALDQLASSLSLKADEPNKLEWVSQAKKHWQILAREAPEAAEVTDAREGTRGSCPVGMVEVDGEFLVDSRGTERSDEVESLQSKTCATWLNKEFPARCADFDPQAWESAKTKLQRKPMRFCIDRYEYPNQRGAYPWIVATYTEAQRICGESGKRLCSESEWTFACEGEEGTPYPGSYERDGAACVTDRPWREFDPAALGSRASERAEREVNRLWQGEASGSRATCRSSFGVYDMTGNVDEWTRSSRPSGRRSVLKGGYWGPVRARCRPATRAHDENFVAYQQGFRCCADAQSAAEPEEAEEPALDGGLSGVEPASAEREPPAAEQESPAESSVELEEQLDEDEALGQRSRGVSKGCGRTP